MIKYVVPFLLLLVACSEGTGLGDRPTIVFSGSPQTTGPSPDLDIYVMDSLGGHVTNVTRNPALDDDPAWSPDGSKIMFSSAGRDTTGRWHLFLMRDDGGKVTFRGRYAACLAPDALDMSVLGRDILSMFAVIVDRPANILCLLGGQHSYRVYGP